MNPTRALILEILGEAKFCTLIDLKHTPDEVAQTSIGGKCRSPIVITAEVGWFNSFTAKYMFDQSLEMPEEEEIQAFFQTIETKLEARKILRKGFQDLEEAINQMDDADFATEISAPWGQPYTKGGFLMHAIAHTFYHDGQICYAQAFHGDDTIHWTETN